MKKTNECTNYEKTRKNDYCNARRNRRKVKTDSLLKRAFVAKMPLSFQETTKDSDKIHPKTQPQMLRVEKKQQMIRKSV